GVGARDVEETGTIERANLHVLDRFGLDGKISCLCPTYGEQARRRAQHKALNQLHVNLQVALLGEARPNSCAIALQEKEFLPPFTLDQHSRSSLHRSN